MPDLTLRARFPLGYYQAHDADGWPEWPPHPLRFAAALLSAASGHPDEDQLARRIFTWTAPTLWTPPTSSRDIDFERWVPIDPLVNINSKREPLPGRKRIGDKMPKQSERATMLASPYAVILHFSDADLTPEESPRLDRILQRVTYLGRPTSPVVIDRLSTFDPPCDLGDLWEPDPHGTKNLRIATPAEVVRLDERHAQRLQFPDPGYHPRSRNATVAAYRLTSAGAVPTTVQPANRATIEEAVSRMAWLPTPGASADDVLAIAALLVGQAPRDRQPSALALLPAYWEDNHRGTRTARLSGVLITPAITESVVVLIAGTLKTCRPRLVPTEPARHRQIRQAWATSPAWTTSFPIAPHNLWERFEELGHDHGATLTEVQTHDAPRDPLAPRTDTHPNLTHASVMFDQQVSGPLQLDNTLLTPIQPILN